ncbi:MAG: helix-turn-helix domain-containing protein [Pseudomonadota bacterium]
MPYRPEHKAETRARIVECARRLFNRRGFSEVSIEEIMAEAGLTRGGFYHHFKTKDALYSEAVNCHARSNPMDKKDGGPIDLTAPQPSIASQIVNAYLSRQHLERVEAQCPLIALPSDVARAGPAARAAYQDQLERLIGLFEAGLAPNDGDRRDKAMTMAALCVGGMILARTIDDEALGERLREAARRLALEIGDLDREQQD